MVALGVMVALAGCQGDSPDDKKNEVVVYSSVDDIFVRPITERFQKETGIRVRLVTDTEETKSTGLLNRLIAEKSRAQADVFWSGDPVRAAILKARGVSTAYHSPNAEGMPVGFSDVDGYWQALSARARIILYNKDLVPPGEEPRSLDAFLDPRWRGKACLANPLFGTSSMHAAALFSLWGDERAGDFFEGMSDNGVVMLSSNGEVKRGVAAGDFAFGLADTDDASVAIKEGKPVGVIYPDGDGMGTLLIPNAAVLIAGGPNPENGRRFIDFLLTPEVEEALAKSEAAQMPLRPGVPVPASFVRLEDITTLDVDYADLAPRLDQLSHGYLKEWAARNADR